MEDLRCFRLLAVFWAVSAIASMGQANTAQIAQCTSVTASAGPDCEIAVSV